MDVAERTLDQWMDYIQTLHAREIDLSLDRVKSVLQSMQPEGVSFKAIIVAGTNGKGSTSELLSSIFRAAGYSTAKYTSPHLVRFTERFIINGSQVSETELVESLTAVEAARSEVPLTFFEYGTLAAIDLFAKANVDIAVMEIGLGGRLDAVNVLDPEVSVITNIALDHTAWLGDTVEEIATEKFGVARTDKPCVIGMIKPPEVLLQLAKQRGVNLIKAGADFDKALATGEDSIKEQSGLSAQRWSYFGVEKTLTGLPLPFSQKGHQLDNAAAALAVIECLPPEFKVGDGAIKNGLRAAQMRGRCQLVSSDPAIVVDVAHNEASVAALAEFVAGLNIQGRTFAICGMLKDKQIDRALSKILSQIDDWNFATIHDARGSKASEMLMVVQELDSKLDANNVGLFDDVVEGFDTVSAKLTEDDCLLVFGSFFIAGDIIRHLSQVNL